MGQVVMGQTVFSRAITLSPSLVVKSRTRHVSDTPVPEPVPGMIWFAPALSTLDLAMHRARHRGGTPALRSGRSGPRVMLNVNPVGTRAMVVTTRRF